MKSSRLLGARPFVEAIPAGRPWAKLQLGMLLVLTPDALNRVGVAFALVGVALGVIWLAARFTHR